jgi:hypothetical protein
MLSVCPTSLGVIAATELIAVKPSFTARTMQLTLDRIAATDRILGLELVID